MAKPFVMWPGGKRRLLPQLKKLMPKKYNKYIEPFVGAGALFFEINPKEAIINDANGMLIITYKEIKYNPKELIEELKKHQAIDTKDYYYKVRAWDRVKTGKHSVLYSKVIAGRFIYLIGRSFSNLYRVNSKGEFNMPFGHENKPFTFDEKNIMNVSKRLKNTRIYNQDFEDICSIAEKGDFVYLDPPYFPISKTSNFVSYTKNGFDKLDHKRVKKVFNELTKKGVKVMMSNSSADWVYENYKEHYIVEVDIHRLIAPQSVKRGVVKEVIITNYKPENWDDVRITTPANCCMK